MWYLGWEAGTEKKSLRKNQGTLNNVQFLVNINLSVLVQ